MMPHWLYRLIATAQAFVHGYKSFKPNPEFPYRGSKLLEAHHWAHDEWYCTRSD